MNMKIVISDTTEPEILEKMKQRWEIIYKPENLFEALKDAEVLIVRSKTKVTKEVIDHAPKLKLVGRAGVGLDNVDVNYCKEKGIKIVNTPSAPRNAVAELVVGMIISLLRAIYRGHTEMKKKNWLKKELLGNEVQGKTLGIIGFGGIGKVVADKAKAMGMKVLAYDLRPVEPEYAKFVRQVGIDTLLAESDVISLHTVLVPETKGMINKKTIEKMKDGAFIVNTARGELIEEEALYEALKSGKLAGAALDVFWQEPYSGKLLELENVLFTPHIGGNTKEAQIRIGEELIEALKELNL